MLAPFYDIVPVLADQTVTHEMGFEIGAARVADDITGDDLQALARDIGTRRVTPGQRRRLRVLLEGCVAAIGGMAGPVRKRLGDVISQQARHIAPALGAEIEIPPRDLVVVNRPA